MKKLFCSILVGCFFICVCAFAEERGKVCVKGVLGLAYIAHACVFHSGERSKDCKDIAVGQNKVFARLHYGDMLTITARGGKRLINLTIGSNLNFGDTVVIKGTTGKPSYVIKQNTCN